MPGKESQQRSFVNAAGEKETQILILAVVKNQAVSQICQIFLILVGLIISVNYDNMWMKSDIMINVLTKLNNRLQRTDQLLYYVLKD